jgi:hypothetical protein
MAEEEEGTNAMLAVGVAGYTLSMELLTTFKEQVLISHDEAASVLDRNFAALERTDASTSHPAFRLARQALDRQLALWQEQRQG